MSDRPYRTAPDAERCGHVLCGRTAFERDTADAECALDDCPFRDGPWAPAETSDGPLARAVREARGGPAPRTFRGYA